jgi:hypothetical protein
MTTLASAILELAKILGYVRQSTTTAAGTATTLVDSARDEPNDFWNKGTLWVLSGAHAGKTRRISDWALSGTTLTHDTLTTAAGSGVSYALADLTYPRDVLIDAVQRALRSMGDLPDYDTSLTTVAEQVRYQLPAGVYNVREVSWGDSEVDPIHYPLSYAWREIDGYIEFDAGRQPMVSGRTLRLTYMAPHAAVSADTDTISDYVHVERLIWEAAVHARRWKFQRTGKKADADLLNEALAQAAVMAGRHPVPKVHKSARLPL